MYRKLSSKTHKYLSEVRWGRDSLCCCPLECPAIHTMCVRLYDGGILRVDDHRIDRQYTLQCVWLYGGKSLALSCCSIECQAIDTRCVRLYEIEYLHLNYPCLLYFIAIKKTNVLEELRQFFHCSGWLSIENKYRCRHNGIYFWVLRSELQNNQL